MTKVDSSVPRNSPIASAMNILLAARRRRRSEAASSPALAARPPKMTLDHDQQAKNMLVSDSPKKPGFFRLVDGISGGAPPPPRRRQNPRASYDATA